jgi:uncharacterized SAM-binding protein YcdF (DUF218 family)
LGLEFRVPILLEKVFTLVILPVSLSLALGMTAALLLVFRRQQLASMALMLSLAVLWVFSTPLIAQSLIASLETHFAMTTEGAEEADVAILLGGGSDNLGRALHASRLLRAGRVRFILISAGNVPWYEAREPEAQSIARLLKEWGIADDVLIVESESRNTFENAQRSKPIWDAHGFKSGLLVTSAFHMPRALAVFRQAGFAVEPAPTNFYGGPSLEEGVLAILPNAGALQASSVALKEWLGLLVYRLRGWA